MKSKIAAALTLVALALSACSKGYQVDVRNSCNHPIEAELVHAGGGGKNETRAGVHIGPGDRATLAEHKAPGGYRFLLWIDAPNNPGARAELNLAPGLTVVDVTHDAPDQPLRVREIQ